MLYITIYIVKSQGGGGEGMTPCTPTPLNATLGVCLTAIVSFFRQKEQDAHLLNEESVSRACTGRASL